MEEQNKRKGIIYLVIGLVTLLILVVGATYAYFQAQSGNEQSANVNVSTSTTDSLTFTLNDIDVSDSSEPKNIKDENNQVEGNDNTDIVINATQDNFGSSGTSLGDGVSAKATLMANSETKTATKNYNVYLVLDLNELEYTTTGKTPELILTVTEPGENNPTQTIVTALAYHEKDSSNERDISGFDITGKRQVVEIAKGYEIKAKDTQATIQEWKVQVTLVNLKANQNNNTGKSITGKVVITADEVEELTDINKVDIERATNSITATVNKEGLTDYYFKIDGGTTPISAISLGSEEEWSHETTSSHTFNTLQDGTEYTISAYGVDENGYKTNIYETKVTTGEGELPSITNVTVEETTYNSVKVNVTASNATKYEYEISGAALTTPKVETKEEATYTFTELAEQQQYTIKVRAIDGEDNKSADYEITATTGKMPLAIKCQDQTAQCLADNSSADSTLIFHNGTNDKDAHDESYRYSGASDKVNNYVCFGGECSNDPEQEGYKYLYRIIGVFKNTQGQYEMKIIKADAATKEDLGDTTVTGGAYKTDSTPSTSYYKGKLKNYASYYWNSTDSEHLDYNTNTNSNMWKDSNLNTKNLNEKFYNAIDSTYKGMIENHEWQVGAKWNTGDAKEVYDNELGEKKLTTTSKNCYTQGSVIKDQSARLCDQQNDLTYQANVGLMYISDYMYGTLPEYWNTTAIYYSQDNVKNNNWLYLGLYEWTISRNSYYVNEARHVYDTGNAYGDGLVYNLYGVRPVLYLISNTKISSGSGTAEDPMKLEIE